MSRIAPFKKGDAKRTPMRADALMEIVNPVNALSSMEVKPTGMGRLVMPETTKETNAILDLTGMADYMLKGSAFVPFPWCGRDASQPGEPKLAIWLGTCNEVEPSNGDSLTWLTLDVSGDGEVWDEVVTDATSGDVTSHTVNHGASTPADPTNSTGFNVKLGTYTVSGDVVTYTPIVTENINFSRLFTYINGVLCWQFFRTFERDAIPINLTLPF